MNYKKINWFGISFLELMGLFDFIFTLYLLTNYAAFIGEANPFFYPYFLMIPLLFLINRKKDAKFLFYATIPLMTLLIFTIIINIINFERVLMYL